MIPAVMVEIIKYFIPYNIIILLVDEFRKNGKYNCAEFRICYDMINYSTIR